MRPVIVVALPHNYRLPLYQPGEAPDTYGDPAAETARDTSEWASLPIPMPRCLVLTVDAEDRVIAARADGKRIKWADLDVIVRGVQEYNADLAHAGTRHELLPFEPG
jgi:hypothetical protein